MVFGGTVSIQTYYAWDSLRLDASLPRENLQAPAFWRDHDLRWSLNLAKQVTQVTKVPQFLEL
jgi:hypothetical protein